MALAIGIALALAVAGFAALVGLDRDRAFYPTVLIVIAGLYDLFAAMAGGGSVIWIESAIGAGFVFLAVLGFRRSLWWAVAGLAGHGLFDALRGDLIANAGVPQWWPAFCLGYDVAAAACLAWLLLRRGGIGGRASLRAAG